MPRESLEAPLPFPHILLYVSLHIVFICILCYILYYQPVNISVSLSSLSYSGKLLIPRKESWKLCFIADHNLGLAAGICSGSSRGGLTANVGCGIWW